MLRIQSDGASQPPSASFSRYAVCSATLNSEAGSVGLTFCRVGYQRVIRKYWYLKEIESCISIVSVDAFKTAQKLTTSHVKTCWCTYTCRTCRCTLMAHLENWKRECAHAWHLVFCSLSERRQAVLPCPVEPQPDTGLFVPCLVCRAGNHRDVWTGGGTPSMNTPLFSGVKHTAALSSLMILATYTHSLETLFLLQNGKTFILTVAWHSTMSLMFKVTLYLGMFQFLKAVKTKTF